MAPFCWAPRTYTYRQYVVQFIAKAKRFRKKIGGGMRQVGVIAAPAIVALKTMVDPLREDHQVARELAA